MGKSGGWRWVSGRKRLGLDGQIMPGSRTLGCLQREGTSGSSAISSPSSWGGEGRWGGVRPVGGEVGQLAGVGRTLSPASISLWNLLFHLHQLMELTLSPASISLWNLLFHLH